MIRAVTRKEKYIMDRMRVQFPRLTGRQIESIHYHTEIGLLQDAAITAYSTFLETNFSKVLSATAKNYLNNKVNVLKAAGLFNNLVHWAEYGSDYNTAPTNGFQAIVGNTGTVMDAPYTGIQTSEGWNPNNAGEEIIHPISGVTTNECTMLVIGTFTEKSNVQGLGLLTKSGVTNQRLTVNYQSGGTIYPIVASSSGGAFALYCPTNSSSGVAINGTGNLFTSLGDTSQLVATLPSTGFDTFQVANTYSGDNSLYQASLVFNRNLTQAEVDAVFRAYSPLN